MGSLTPRELRHLVQPCPRPASTSGPCPGLLPPLTLVVIWDVVRSFSVDKQGRQTQWLVSLISQADIVVSWTDRRARSSILAKSPSQLSATQSPWTHLSGWQRQAGCGAQQICHPPQRLQCEVRPAWAAQPVGSRLLSYGAEPGPLHQSHQGFPCRAQKPSSQAVRSPQGHPWDKIGQVALWPA